MRISNKPQCSGTTGEYTLAGADRGEAGQEFFSGDLGFFWLELLSEEQIEMSQRPTDGLVGSADKVLNRCVGNVRV